MTWIRFTLQNFVVTEASASVSLLLLLLLLLLLSSCCTACFMQYGASCRTGLKVRA
jgi:hypothetical protein